MARVGGRSAWVAWPAAVICIAVIAGLVWLAAPGVPGAISFIGDTLRSATTATSAPVAGGGREGGARTEAPATDCRSLYPDRLWAELTWTPDVLLVPSTNPPETATSLAQALTPAVRFTCTWTAAGDRRISTTLAELAGDPAPVVQAALAAQGFACEDEDGRLHCERSAGDALEIHDVEGSLWLSSLLTGWVPEDYGRQTASRAYAG